ncbi:WG repeat-containing protein [Lutibacter sp.]|uniref:WG repeat-containing protein n=1 Tax=Lutibacter sp. TaxID=1925666 RepID=UPI0034A070CA
MKNLLIIIFFLQIATSSIAQIMNDVDEVYPFQEDLAAVQKNNQWGFINKQGELVIDYRSDLVVSNNLNNQGELSSYPVFKDNRCLIKKLIDEIYYYGYIDKTGTIVIVPQFLNATNFENGHALIIAPSLEVIGFNKLLNKNIISSNIEEFVINTMGEKVRYLENPFKYNLQKRKSIVPPVFHSKFIAPGIVAAQKHDMKWDVYQF